MYIYQAIKRGGGLICNNIKPWMWLKEFTFCTCFTKFLCLSRVVLFSYRLWFIIILQNFVFTSILYTSSDNLWTLDFVNRLLLDKGNFPALCRICLILIWIKIPFFSSFFFYLFQSNIWISEIYFLCYFLLSFCKPGILFFYLLSPYLLSDYCLREKNDNIKSDIFTTY